jgi:hypothetical protein
MGAVRLFYSWDSSFPSSYETGLRSKGSTLVISVKAPRMNGGAVTHAQVAAAQPLLLGPGDGDPQPLPGRRAYGTGGIAGAGSSVTSSAGGIRIVTGFP